MHALEIALHVRLDESIDQGSDRALVFAVFRQHRRRRATARSPDIPRRRSRRRGARARDWHRNASGRCRWRARRCWRKNRAAARTLCSSSGRNSCPRKFSRPPTSRTRCERHDAFGLHPEIGIAVTFGHRLARDLQDVAKACGDDQPEPADLALQQRVGGNRRAVRQADDAVGGGAGRCQNRHSRRAQDRRPDWPACSRPW